MPTVTTVRTDLRRGINSGAAFKIPCKCATTAAITLEGLQTIDGIAVVADDSVLVKDQSNAVFNGVYWAATGQWTRRPDFDGYFDAKSGTLVWVNQGTTNALTLWRISSSDTSATTGPIPGTDSISFTEVELGGAAGGPVPLFSAYRATSAQTSGSTAIFNSTSGSGAFMDAGYSTSTGVFTVPTNDDYCFRSQILTRDASEPTFTEGILAICVDNVPYCFGASFPDPAVSAEQLPIAMSLGPVRLTAGQTVSVRRVDDMSASPIFVDFAGTCRVQNHPCSRFEGWRFGP